MAPALRATSPDLVVTLKDAAGRSGSFRRFELRNALVVAQVALSIVLLVSTGLFLRSLQNASSIDLGMRTDNVLLMGFDPKLHDYSTDRSRQFLRQLREGLAALPGVESTSFMDIVPLSLGAQSSDYTAAGIGDRGLRQASADYFRVGTDYFRTMGVPLRRGREFDSGQDLGRDVVILNQAMAGRLFGAGDPLGRTIQRDNKTYEIIGIAANSKSRTHGEAQRACVYHFLERDPNAGYAFFGITLAARTRENPRTLIRAAREKIRALDPNLAVFDIETMEEHVSKALLVPRVSAMLLGVFGAVGLTLATIGLYGVISYAVRRRTKEIGIRMALGAPASRVLWGVVRQGMLLAAVGLVIGLAAAAALSRLFTAFLYGISTTDPFTFVAVPAALMGIALLTTLLPARRAARVAPLDALRYE
jgi:predicted permease